MKKNGFTLIEIIAVIVILGVVMTIAVPVVSEQILNSRKSSYISTVKAYTETIMGEYEMKNIGSYLYDDEIMLVPIKKIKLEKGVSEESPFGSYLNNYSYVLIAPENNSYNFYANFLDSAGYGVKMLPLNKLDSEEVKKISKNDMSNISVYTSCSLETNKFEISDVIFEYNDKEYIPCEYRILGNKDSVECDSNNDLTPVVLCEK